MRSRYRRLLLGVIVLLSAVVGVAGHASAVTITEFPTATANNNPQYITTGPDGALWFTEFGDGLTGVGTKIGRVTTSGTMTEFTIPTSLQAPGGAIGITTGPDGALWFTEYFGNKIGRITTSGMITEYPIPTALSLPFGITTGPDGNLWFTESGDSTDHSPVKSDGSRPQERLPNSRLQRPTASPVASRRGRTATCGSPNLAPIKSDGSPPPE